MVLHHKCWICLRKAVPFVPFFPRTPSRASLTFDDEHDRPTRRPPRGHQFQIRYHARDIDRLLRGGTALGDAPTALILNDSSEERSYPSAQGREQCDGPYRAARRVLHARGRVPRLVAARHAGWGVHAAGAGAWAAGGRVCQSYGAQEYRRLAPPRYSCP